MGRSNIQRNNGQEFSKTEEKSLLTYSGGSRKLQARGTQNIPGYVRVQLLKTKKILNVAREKGQITLKRMED